MRIVALFAFVGMLAACGDGVVCFNGSHDTAAEDEGFTGCVGSDCDAIAVSCRPAACDGDAC